MIPKLRWILKIFACNTKQKYKMNPQSGLAFFADTLYNEGKYTMQRTISFGILRLFLEKLRFPKEPIIYEHPAL